MLLLILAHVDTGHHGLVVEEEFGQSLGKFCLTYTRRTQEEEGTDRPLGILQTGTATAYGIGDGFDGLILTDDTFVKLFLQVEEFLLLALQHLADRYTSPT